MKSVVQSRPGGQAYQSIGGALLKTDLSSGMVFGNAEEEAPRPQQHNQPAPQVSARPARQAPAVDVTKPGALKKAIRARIREIKAELKRHAALKQELDELERLLAAATTKPAPKVRALRTG